MREARENDGIPGKASDSISAGHRLFQGPDQDLRNCLRAHLACGSSFPVTLRCAKSARLSSWVRGSRGGTGVAYVVKRARKSGGFSYLVRYHGPDGKTHSRQFAKRVDADRFANASEVAKHNGSWIDPGRGRILFAEWVEKWKPSQVHLRPSSRAPRRELPRHAHCPSLREPSPLQDPERRHSRLDRRAVGAGARAGDSREGEADRLQDPSGSRRRPAHPHEPC